MLQNVMERSVEKTDQKYYCSNYYDVNVHKYGVNCRTKLRFWENKGLNGIKMRVFFWKRCRIKAVVPS